MWSLINIKRKELYGQAKFSNHGYYSLVQKILSQDCPQILEGAVVTMRELVCQDNLAVASQENIAEVTMYIFIYYLLLFIMHDISCAVNEAKSTGFVCDYPLPHV